MWTYLALFHRWKWSVSKLLLKFLKGHACVVVRMEPFQNAAIWLSCELLPRRLLCKQLNFENGGKRLKNTFVGKSLKVVIPEICCCGRWTFRKWNVNTYLTLAGTWPAAAPPQIELLLWESIHKICWMESETVFNLVFFNLSMPLIISSLLSFTEHQHLFLFNLLFEI